MTSSRRKSRASSQEGLVLVGQLQHVRSPCLRSHRLSRAGDDLGDAAWRSHRDRRLPATIRWPGPGTRWRPPPRDTPRPPWTCTAMVAAFDASSAMNTNADGASSGRSSGSLSRNHAARRARSRPPCDGDGDVGERMRDALQRGDRHTERVAGLGELRGDRHRLLDEADQCRARSAAAIHRARVGIPRARRRRCRATVRLSAAAGSTHAIGSLPMLSTLAGRVPKVSATTSSPSRSTIVVGDRAGRDQPHARRAVVLRVEADESAHR